MTSKFGGRFGAKLLLLIIVIEIGIYVIGLGLYSSAPFLPPPGPNPPLGSRATIIGGWAVTAASGLTPVIALTLARKRVGELNAAAWLVFYGTIMIFGEHAFFAIGYTVPLLPPSDPAALGPLFPHARYHFFMSGIYTVVALVLIGVIAFKWLREGRRAAWYAVMLALLIGGGSELTLGLMIYPHGEAITICNQGACNSSIPIGVILYSYIAAWVAALVISYRPVFVAGSAAKSGT